LACDQANHRIAQTRCCSSARDHSPATRPSSSRA
jgi:hypothetical protein